MRSCCASKCLKLFQASRKTLSLPGIFIGVIGCIFPTREQCRDYCMALIMLPFAFDLGSEDCTVESVYLTEFWNHSEMSAPRVSLSLRSLRSLLFEVACSGHSGLNTV